MMFKLTSLLCLFILSLPLGASEIRLAVASNCLGPIHAIAAAFEAETGSTLSISSGSTGKLYAQIVNGAPYDLFFAANNREPERLEHQAQIRPGSRYTYALGILALWAPRGATPESLDARSALAGAGTGRLAIANPSTAPYGAAAEAVLTSWQLMGTYEGRIIRGDNIAQAYQFVATGNAEFGFVALSQMLDPARPPAGRFWRIPDDLYAPIRQQLVILKHGEGNPAVEAFWAYLKSDAARARIKAFGYGLE